MKLRVLTVNVCLIALGLFGVGRLAQHFNYENKVINYDWGTVSVSLFPTAAKESKKVRVDEISDLYALKIEFKSVRPVHDPIIINSIQLKDISGNQVFYKNGNPIEEQSKWDHNRLAVFYQRPVNIDYVDIVLEINFIYEGHLYHESIRLNRDYQEKKSTAFDAISGI